MEISEQQERSMDELMRAQVLSPEEMARVFDIRLSVIRHAAFKGELKATIVDHDIISITRADALAWLNSRD